MFESTFWYLNIRFDIAFETSFIKLDSQNGSLYIWKSAGHLSEQVTFKLLLTSELF